MRDQSKQWPAILTAARQPQRLRQGLLAYAAVVLTTGWALGAWQLHTDRDATVQAARNQLTTLASGLSTLLTAMINDGVGAAEAGANEIAARGGLARLSRSEAEAVLARRLTGGDYVRQLFIVTPTAWYAASRVGEPDPMAMDIPPERLQSLSNEDSAVWIGAPLRTDNVHTVRIPIARRLVATDGAQLWAGALFSIESLDRLYRALPIENGGVAVVRTDGLALAILPTWHGLPMTGVDLSRSAAFLQWQTQSQELFIYSGPHPLTGHPRLIAIRQIPGLPLVAAAGRDWVDVLAPWRQRLHNTLQLGVTATLALVLLTAMLYAVIRRRYEALLRSEERFQLVVTGTTDGVWDWETASDYVYYSPRLKEQLGFDADAEFPPTPKTFWDRIHPEDIERVRESVKRHLVKREPYDVEYRVRTRSGEYRWFRARAQAVWDATGRAQRMAGSISDIHQRKLAEHSLHASQERELRIREEFAQNLLLAQEKERQRLANELHDSVGQNLSLIKNRAQLMLRSGELPASIAPHVAAMEHLAAELIAEIRGVVRNLRPQHIEDIGLTGALDDLLDQVAQASGLTIERRFESVNDVITGDAATHVFRIVQEALNNIIKHAGARHCTVLLERDLHCIRLIVRDDGIGFDPDSSELRHGLGLASMAERARMVSAHWRVTSTPGGGTTLQLEIPIREAAMAE